MKQQCPKCGRDVDPIPIIEVGETTKSVLKFLGKAASAVAEIGGVEGRIVNGFCGEAVDSIPDSICREYRCICGNNWKEWGKEKSKSQKEELSVSFFREKVVYYKEIENWLYLYRYSVKGYLTYYEKVFLVYLAYAFYREKNIEDCKNVLNKVIFFISEREIAYFLYEEKSMLNELCGYIFGKSWNDLCVEQKTSKQNSILTDIDLMSMILHPIDRNSISRKKVLQDLKLCSDLLALNDSVLIKDSGIYIERLYYLLKVRYNIIIDENSFSKCVKIGDLIDLILKM